MIGSFCLLLIFTDSHGDGDMVLQEIRVVHTVCHSERSAAKSKKLRFTLQVLGAPSLRLTCFLSQGREKTKKAKRPESSPGPGPSGFKIGCV
jgi:hypothetical protein